MAKLTTINNPFDPMNSREIKEIESGKPIYAVIDGFYCHFDVVVSLNGHITQDYEYIIKDEDHIGFVAVPSGGGGGKNPFATIAMVALMVAAPYAGAYAGIMWGTTGAALVSTAVTAGVMIGGGMLINSLLPPPSPSFTSTDGMRSSATYNWDNVSNQYTEGVVLPIVYGKAKIVPPIISQYVETVGSKQYLNLLYALNDGEIATVSDITINNNPITYYTDVETHIRLGTNDQTLIPSFDNIRIDTPVNAKLSTVATVRQTSYNNVQALNIIVTAPGGLYYANNAGGLDSRTVDLEVMYRIIGDPLWTTIVGTSISGASNSNIRATFKVDNLLAGQYEISCRRLSSESTSARTHDSVYFETFTEIIYDDFIYPNTALMAIRALATDQLSGSMPAVSCVVDRGFGMSNPALASKNFLTLLGAKVNAESFLAWETWCNSKSIEIGLVLDTDVGAADTKNILGVLGHANLVEIAQEYFAIIEKEESLATQRFLFTMGNIIKDSYEENYLPLADRSNVVEITYYDKTLGYERQSIELYQRGFDESVDTIRKTSISYPGCVNREDAIRKGRELLNKNRYLTKTISFDADADAMVCTMGDLIDVSHDIPAEGLSGRIINAALNDPTKWVFVDGVFVDSVLVDETTLNLIKIDREVTLEAGVIYHLTVKFNSDDSRETVQVVSNTTVTTDTLPTPAGFSKPLEDYMLYSIGEANMVSKLYRILTISKSSNQRHKISAIEYIPEVYGDSTDAINVVTISSLASVSSLLVVSRFATDIKGISTNIVDLSWIGQGIGWNVYSRSLGATSWDFEGYTTVASFQIIGARAGNYEYKVGDKVQSVIVDELPSAPSLTNVTMHPRYTGVQFELTYDNLFDGFDHVEVWEASLAQTINDAVLIGTTTSKVYQRYSMEIIDSRNYWFRIVDMYGNTGLFFGAVVGTTSTNITAIMSDLKIQQGTPQYMPALSDILIAGYVSGVASLGIDGNLFVDGTVTANKLAVMGLSTFTNDEGFTDDTAANAAQTAASNAQSTANTASTNATSALTQLTDIASDNVLSPVEKSTVIADYAVIIAEQNGIDTQATNYGITTEKTSYDTSVTALTTYLGTLTAPVAWNVTTGNTTIVGATFRTKFNDVYTSRQTLLNKIAATAKTLADSAGSAANSAQTAANNAQTTANTASTNATAALTQLTDIASDNVLSPVEKSTVIADYAVIIAEQNGIDTQAT
ncbi:MAG: phage tail protein, partial [Sulfuricurvum sp.]|uniref:TipJ family phage tail tip protein n=1 Tax=Sulfuricurvum sp. TaxID=2025608 RepID=UPI002616020D